MDLTLSSDVGPEADNDDCMPDFTPDNNDDTYGPDWMPKMTGWWKSITKAR